MPASDDVSHALLLRLFQSEFFSPHLALSYLKTYSDSIGITYYLVEQLRTSFDPSEVEFYWAQFCHLLISRPSKSRALECFILQRCDESVHVALLTLWFFQAALYDLSSDPQTDSFQVCQRVFNQCQRLLYDDPLADTDVVTSYSGSSVALGTLRRRLRIKARAKKGEKLLPSNALPCFVGMGAVIASVPGMPRLAGFAGKMAIEEGRKKPQGRHRAPLEGSGMQRVPVGDQDSNVSDEDHDHSIDDDDDDDDDLEGAERHSHVDSFDQANQSQQGSANGKQKEVVSPKLLGKPFDDEKGEVAFQAPTPTSPKANVAAIRTAGPSPKGTHSKSPSTPQRRTPVRTNSKDMNSAILQFTSGFNGLKDKAAAAVNDVFGQTFGVEFAPGTSSKELAAPPLWHRQHRRKGSGIRTVVSEYPSPPRHSSVGERVRQGASEPNLAARSSISASPFASNVTLSEDPTQMTPDAVLARYDGEARRRLLRSNYCRKQTHFLQTLQDISARLLLLPKPARLSALRAELTELNHNLPAEVCFPMWCEAAAQENQETSDATVKNVPGAARSKRGRHHRVLRINPSEAVVLNSADRAPFLLHVEILLDDMDFDPERKQNRESLKKLVMQEDVRRRKTAMSRQFSSSVGQLNRVSSRADAPPASAQIEESKLQAETSGLAPDDSLTVEIARRRTPPPLLRPPLRVPTPAIEEEPSGQGEEIDLTEQAYGSDLAAFGEERIESESDDDDLALVNLSHDNAAWARSIPGKSSVPATPSGSLTQKEVMQLAASSKKAFSLDEYAERMRTAAIMLAQLNQSTNASAQPIVASNPHVSSTAQGGWSSWIMGTSWAANANGGRSEAGQGSAGVKAPISPTNGSSSTVVSSTVNGAGTGVGILGPANTARGTGKRLMQTDTEMIRKRIMQEMMALEEERMERMKVASNRRSRKGANVEDEATVQRAVNKDDPSAAMFRESWAMKKARIRASSPYGHLESWDVFSVIVKTGADLRQEQLAVQLVQEFARIWGDTGSRCWVRYFRILVTSENSGIMETVTDAVSVHSIKKEAYSRRQQQLLEQNREQSDINGAAPAKIATYSLLDHYIDTYGDPSSSKFGKARQRFIESLAGYSILSYLLQIKDRHNGNILVDGEGHLIHIDFGFMLGISPGGVGFEAAPFKMPQEYIDLMGGADSPKFIEFKSLVCQGFRDVRKHAERIIMIVELMQKDSKLPCFALGDLTSSYLRDRFQLALSQSQCDEFVDRLITSSMNSTFTRLYDQYQYYSEGILS